MPKQHLGCTQEIMNKLQIRVLLFSIVAMVYLAFVGASSGFLPDCVASHFNATGQPDGWMGREGYTLFMSVMGVGLPIFIVGLMYSIRFFPDWTVNLPHKNYWSSPEHRHFTADFMVAHSFWLAGLMIYLMAGAHFLTIQANRSVPVHLPGAAFGVLMAGFLAGMAVWVIALLRRFRHPLAGASW